MKLPTTLTSVLLLAALPLVSLAQYTTTRIPATDAETGARAGNLEVILGANGGSDQDFDNHFGGASGSLGFYFSDTLEGVVRQSLNYGDNDASKSQWNGSTFLAADFHLAPRGSVRPFIGANFGRIYGDTVQDTWAAGLEGGLKFYVKPKTFIIATAQYAWLFDKTKQLDDKFSDGQFLWSVGIGFNL
jgi:hypothetical protein